MLIDFSGQDGKHGVNGRDGRDGRKGQGESTNGSKGTNGTNGTNGTKGTDGTNGKNAKHINGTIERENGQVVLTLNRKKYIVDGKVTILANGGNGGNASKGGKGGRGGRAQASLKQNGQNGQNGADGYAGDGGDGGDVIITSKTDPSLANMIIVKNKGGEGGKKAAFGFGKKKDYSARDGRNGEYNFYFEGEEANHIQKKHIKPTNDMEIEEPPSTSKKKNNTEIYEEYRLRREEEIEDEKEAYIKKYGQNAYDLKLAKEDAELEAELDAMEYDYKENIVEKTFGLIINFLVEYGPYVMLGLKVIIAVLLPPLFVLLFKGLGKSLKTNLILTLILFVPGSIHAIWLLGKDEVWWL